MNNEQNNIIGGAKPIPPTPSPIPPVGSSNPENIISTPQSIDNNPILEPTGNSIGIVATEPIANTKPETLLGDSSLTSASSTGTIPITPVPETTASQPIADSGISTPPDGQILSVNSNSIVPEMASNPNNTPVQSQNLNAEMPELKIDSVGPFDIGIGSPTLPPIGTSSAQTSEATITTPINTMNNITTSQTIIPDPTTPPSNNTDTNNITSQENNIVSVRKYLGTMILFSIPIVGFIMLLIKAFDKKDKNISNLAKAQLLIFLIIGLIGFIATVILGASLAPLISGS